MSASSSIKGGLAIISVFVLISSCSVQKSLPVTGQQSIETSTIEIRSTDSGVIYLLDGKKVALSKLPRKLYKVREKAKIDDQDEFFTFGIKTDPDVPQSAIIEAQMAIQKAREYKK